MRLTTGFVLWLVAAAAATAVGLAAVAAIGTDIFGAGHDPLSESEVDQLLASQTSTPSTPPATPPATMTTAPTTAPTTTAPALPPTLQTPTAGGTVVSRCTADGLVQVVTATPAQGWWLDHEDDVEDHPTVKFTNGDEKYEVRLRCVAGTPVPEVRHDD